MKLVPGGLFMFRLKKSGLVPAAAIGLLFAVCLTALLCLPLSAAVYRELVPSDSAGALAYIAAGLSVFFTVFIIARRRARQALPTAGLIAGGYCVLAAIVCAVCGTAARFGVWLAVLAAAVAVGALLGAVLSIRKKPRARRH